jgi:long-subunit acyl-CoA synthetase (AMP-forming)
VRVVDISDLPERRNLVELLLARADARGDAPFLWAKQGGGWQPISWAEAVRQVCCLAESLRALGLKDGDRVMLVSENRPQWCIADFAIMAAGCIAVEARIAKIGRGDTACLIYTSGTGGSPRGVMQHHGAILMQCRWRRRILAEDFGLDDDDVPVLPAAEPRLRAYRRAVPADRVGAQIYYAEGLEKLASNIEEVRPTMMVVVPRLFEVLRARIMKQVEKQGKVANFLMDRALGIGSSKAAGGATVGATSRWTWSGKNRCARRSAALWRPIEGDGFGRRAAQSRSRRVLRIDGADHAAGLWPDRSRPGDFSCNRPARRPQDGHGRPAAARGRGERSPKMAKSWCAANW